MFQCCYPVNTICSITPEDSMHKQYTVAHFRTNRCFVEGAYLVFSLECVLFYHPSRTFPPSCCAQSQFTVTSAVISEVILCSVEFTPKGLLGVRYLRTSSVSAMSLSCRAFETSVCYSLVVHDTSVTSCIAQFT